MRCFRSPTRFPRTLTGHRPPKPAPRPPSHITARRASHVGTSSASRGPGVPFPETLFHPEKAPSLGNLPFGDQEARGASQPMRTHGANKETQDPQRAPRTPGVRSQELHLCANGAGLGIRDYQSPELRAAVRSLCPEGSGRFLVPPPTSSTELSEAEGKRVPHCLLGEHWGRAEERPAFNR